MKVYTFIQKALCEIYQMYIWVNICLYFLIRFSISNVGTDNDKKRKALKVIPASKVPVRIFTDIVYITKYNIVLLV